MGEYQLDDKANIVVSGKVDCCLDVLDAGGVDHVGRIPPLGAISGRALFEETRVALGPLGENCKRSVQVERSLACVVGEEAARLGIEVGRGTIANRGWWEGAEKGTPNGLVELAPCFRFRPR